MTELIPNLFIGNWQEAKICATQGYHVITVAADSEFVGHQHFKLVDGPGNNKNEFIAAIKATKLAHHTGQKVMVHCVGGRSRSAAVIVAAVTKITGRPFCDVYDELLRKHDGPDRGARIHPHLSVMLLDYLEPK